MLDITTGMLSLCSDEVVELNEKLVGDKPVGFAPLCFGIGDGGNENEFITTEGFKVLGEFAKGDATGTIGGLPMPAGTWSSVRLSVGGVTLSGPAGTADTPGGDRSS